MIARDFISHDVPALKCSDNGHKALNIMELFRISHLPIVRDNEYLGLISDKDLYDLELENTCLAKQKLSLVTPFVFDYQHIFEVAQAVGKFKVSAMPVLDSNRVYQGLILSAELSERIVELVAVNEPGAILVLEMSAVDYSLSQIAQIVESNDAKILSLYTSNPTRSSQFEVTLKVNVTDASSIIQTFARYDYNLKAVYMDNSILNDMYNSRYEQFMKFISI